MIKLKLIINFINRKSFHILFESSRLKIDNLSSKNKKRLKSKSFSLNSFIQIYQLLRKFVHMKALNSTFFMGSRSNHRSRLYCKGLQYFNHRVELKLGSISIRYHYREKWHHPASFVPWDGVDKCKTNLTIATKSSCRGEARGICC